MKVFVYIEYMYCVYLLCVYINIHTFMYTFKKKLLYINIYKI